MPKPFVVTPQDRPEPLNLVGEHLTVLASGQQTEGYELFLQGGPEGSGPPPHNHDWDESFYVISGEVAFGVEDQQEVVAMPGTLVHLPAGTTHWFRMGPGGAEMLSMTSREGASGAFMEIDRDVDSENPDFGLLGQIAGKHGINIAVPAT